MTGDEIREGSVLGHNTTSSSSRRPTSKGPVKALPVHLGDDKTGGRDPTVLRQLLPEVMDAGCVLNADAKLDLM